MFPHGARATATPLETTPTVSKAVANKVNVRESLTYLAGFLLPVSLMNEAKVANVKTTLELNTDKLLNKAVSIYLFSSAAKHKAFN